MYAFFGLGGYILNPSVVSRLSFTIADWLQSGGLIFFLQGQILWVTSDH